MQKNCSVSASRYLTGQSYWAFLSRGLKHAQNEIERKLNGVMDIEAKLRPDDKRRTEQQDRRPADKLLFCVAVHASSINGK
jgi:hypothetical protein